MRAMSWSFLAAGACAILVAFAGGITACSSPNCAGPLDCPGSASDAGTDSIGDGHAGRDAKDSAADRSKEGSDGAVDADDADTSVDQDTGPTCTPGAAPADGGCVEDTSGVFVSPTGMDVGGIGTMEKPLATISYALAHLSGAKAVYVCGSGSGYTDQITVTTGISIYGGMACTAVPWTYSTTAIPQVTGTSTDFTLKVAGVTGAVDVEDMAFTAPSASGAIPGESSIAAFVTGSSNVTFKRTTITSGSGATGAAGTAVDAWVDASAPAGANAIGGTGGTSQACPCGSITGGGGNSGASPGSGSPGSPQIDGGIGGDGKGGVYGTPVPLSCNIGDVGATAPAAPGGVGEDGGGALSASGWDGGSGAIGIPGGEGQGGGGGSGGVAGAGSGGGSAGGCGGCGGGPGTGGGAGGASFALVTVGATVVLDGCALTSGTGGKGGTGGPGQSGQPGGFAGSASPPGCPGGTGGTGGQAGGGGGGAGGYSVAIAYVGKAPTQKNGTTATPGSGGAAGPAGTGGSPAPTPGAPGVAAAVLGF